jgi:hypothetical protein
MAFIRELNADEVKNLDLLRMHCEHPGGCSNLIFAAIEQPMEGRIPEVVYLCEQHIEEAKEDLI